MDRLPESYLTTAGNLDQPVDMIWIMRGGGTDVYTLISNLARLQQRLPNNHLSDSQPYIMADSAGAYPASGLIAPKPVDPLLLPHLFATNISRYLSRDRDEAAAALRETIGDMSLRDSKLPICLSSVEITQRLERAYFRYFPENYVQGREGLIVPANCNDHFKVAKSVLASSAFGPLLGDYSAEDRRFMDMAFMEGHINNLVEFVTAHKGSRPDRRLVCVIFGNFYKDFRIGHDEKLSLKGLNRHFPDAIRSLVQNDIVNLAQLLLGRDNVFDMSMYVEQPFSAEMRGPKSNAFRSDPLAIRERIAWTDDRLDKDERNEAQLDALARLIKYGAIPSTTPAPREAAAPPPLKFSELSRREKILSARYDFSVAVSLAAELAGDYVQPVWKRVQPVLQSGGNLSLGVLEKLGRALLDQWHATAPWREHTSESIYYKLMHGDKPPARKAAETAATQPLPTHSSEQHTPSGFEHRLP